MAKEPTDRWEFVEGYGEVFIHHEKMWGTLRSGKTVYLGPVPNPHEQQPSGVTNLVPKIIESSNIDLPENRNFGTRRGRPKKEVDEKRIVELSKEMTVREIAEKTGVPRSTVSRIIAGQKVLV